MPHVFGKGEGGRGKATSKMTGVFNIGRKRKKKRPQLGGRGGEGKKGGPSFPSVKELCS